MCKMATIRKIDELRPIPDADAIECTVIAEAARYMRFEVTEKLEGSSMTVFMHDGEFGVCSRNLELKFSESNAFWAAAIKYDIENKMRQIGFDNIAIQGKLIGPGIQGNIYNLTSPEFHVFDIYDIYNGEYLTPQLRRDVVAMLQLNHVPVIMSDVMLPSGTAQDIVATILDMAEGKSMLNDKQEREGIVFKSVIGGITFKAISNKYLQKSVWETRPQFSRCVQINMVTTK